MPSKESIEKSKSWEWATSVEPHQVTQEHIEKAYRVKLKPCNRTICRRNCRSNPHCLTGLGEKFWIEDFCSEKLEEIEDPNLEKRQTFVGLKNLGATCYVNSFLQLLHHNPAFRKAVYEWKPEEASIYFEDSVHTVNSSTTESISDYIHHLQRTFALLQFSSRKYIDPMPFINSLGLNTNQQQDAQEFSKLFISNLEETNSSVRNVVQAQYSGEYAYVTRCNHCSSESSRPSRFYELDLNIKGHHDLHECLQEFLQEENLVGSNQYDCNICQCKRDAVRSIHLVHLPPFLHLQLLRFMFDRQTNRKKKITSTVSFPEILDMSKYLKQPDNTIMYDLCAVLIHCGQSAYSGHYVAQIKDRGSGNWFKFNDETVEKMENKKLQLGNEGSADHNGHTKSHKGSKLFKGQHASSCAYMLVYKLRQENEKEYPPDNSDEWNLPEYLKSVVNEDNARFEEYVRDLTEMREKNMLNAKEKQKEIKNIYDILPAKEGCEYEFLSCEWIVKWLNSEDPKNTVQLIDHKDYLCAHGKLHPDKVNKVKCISIEAAEIIFKKYGGGPRLKNALCEECVRSMCKIIRMKNRLQNDQKIISTLRKTKLTDDEEAYWVGKCSFQQWKSLVLEIQQISRDKSGMADDVLENDDQVCPIAEISCSDDIADHSCSSQSKSADEDQKILQFNEDVVCEHNRLSASESARVLVNAEIWRIFKSYFPNTEEFSRNAEVCLICQEKEAENQKILDRFCTLAFEQKTLLGDLYRDRHRPTYQKARSGVIMYIVGNYFIESWKKFIKDPQHWEPVTEVSNNTLLCSHNCLIHSPEVTVDMDPQSCLVLITEEEWENMKNLFTIDYEISVVVIKEEGQEPYIVSSPILCQTCYDIRMKEKEQERLQFSNAKIYVKQVTKSEQYGVNSLAEPFTMENQMEPNSSSEVDPDFIQWEFELLEDLDNMNHNILPIPTYSTQKSFSYSSETKKVESPPMDRKTDWIGNKNVKKRRTEGGVGNVLVTESPARRSTRKSSRRTKLRGEKEVIVSSNQTLLDLKSQIMNLFNVATFDQHLYLDGRHLSDNKATLCKLNVLPESLILLKVDEAPDYVAEDYMKVQDPETGFQGTELMRK